jgi:hypothetical protein
VPSPSFPATYVLSLTLIPSLIWSGSGSISTRFALTAPPPSRWTTAETYGVGTLGAARWTIENEISSPSRGISLRSNSRFDWLSGSLCAGALTCGSANDGTYSSFLFLLIPACLLQWPLMFEIGRYTTLTGESIWQGFIRLHPLYALPLWLLIAAFLPGKPLPAVEFYGLDSDPNHLAATWRLRRLRSRLGDLRAAYRAQGDA